MDYSSMTSKQAYSVTLSRAHKLAERLDAAIKEGFSTLEVLNRSFQVENPEQAASVAATLQGNAQKRQETAQQVSELIEDLYALREQIAASNVKFGISKVLGQVSKLSREEKLFDALGASLDMQSLVSGFPVAKLPSLTWENFRTENVRRVTFTVEPVGADEVQTLQEQKRKSAMKRNALMDEISDLNRNKVGIMLGEHSAKVCSLID